jgi:hypothetical protein
VLIEKIKKNDYHFIILNYKMLKPTVKTNIQPTFLLKNINSNILYEKYKSGYFNRPIKTKTPIESVRPILKTSSLYNNINLNTKVITSGEKNVECFTKNGYIMPLGGRCQNCNIDFTQEQIGYPLAYECKYIVNQDCYKQVHLFWTEGCFHSYSCCLNYIRKIKNDNLMCDAEIMLKLMYRLTYNTDEPLHEDNDILLLIENGGSLSKEEFNNKNVSYVRTNSVIKIPAQVIYNRI